MATIKQRIEDVTENVTDGKQDIATAINSKNANGVSVGTTSTFSSMANAITLLNIEKVTPPTISFDMDKLELTLTNQTSDAKNYYKQYSSSTWLEYTSPIVVKEDEYKFYATKIGSLDSDVISEVLEDKRGTYNVNLNITLNNTSSGEITDFNGGIDIYTTPPIISNIDGFETYPCERSIGGNKYGSWTVTNNFRAESLELSDIKLILGGFVGRRIDIYADAIHITSPGTYHLGSGYLNGDTINITGTIS